MGDVVTRDLTRILPKETIFHIAEYLYEGAGSRPRSKHFSALHAFARVNSRIRAAVLPLLRRNLNFKKLSELQDLLRRVSNGHVDRMSPSATRTISVVKDARHPWRHGKLHRRSRSLPLLGVTVDAISPFSGLVSFEATQLASTDSTLIALGNCKQLTMIALAWRDTEDWPKLERLPRLQTVRLFIVGQPGHVGVRTFRDLGDRADHFPSITTLSLYNKTTCTGHELRMIDSLWGLHFPNIRVFSLDHVILQTGRAFAFVHRHSTLLEVNLPRCSIRVRLQALLALIGASGSDLNGRGVKKTPISGWAYDPKDLYPQQLSDRLSHVVGFAFIRIPRQEITTSAQEPFYYCSSLSLHLEASEDDLQLAWDFEPSINDVLDRIACSKCCALLKEFSLTTGPNTDVLEYSVAAYMMCLGNQIDQSYGYLHKLEVYWSRLAYFDGWGDDRSFTSFGTSCGPPVPCLDDSRPPLITPDEESPLRERPLTLRDLRLEYDGVEYDNIVATIRKVLHVDDNCELNEDDGTLVMRAWEARNKRFVAHFVRQLASRGNYLKEFDWWLLCHGNLGTMDVLWHWDISRDNYGEVSMVQGSLRWTGCSAGCVPWQTAVGSEREYAMKSWRPEWVYETRGR